MAVPAGLWKGDENTFDTVLAAQWPARRRPTGAQALAAALLVGALRDAGVGTRRRLPIGSARRAAAVAYLGGQTDGTELLPFETVCTLLGWDPDRVRHVVLRQLGPGAAP